MQLIRTIQLKIVRHVLEKAKLSFEALASVKAIILQARQPEMPNTLLLAELE